MHSLLTDPAFRKPDPDATAPNPTAEGALTTSATPESPYDTTIPCTDPIEGLRHMFCTMVQEKRVEQGGQCPARRPVFLRTHGILKGEIDILDDDSVPPAYRHGLFANCATHPVYLRYSSDLRDGRPDYRSTIGLGIKIFNVDSSSPSMEGEPAEPEATADLLLQNVPFFFVDTAADMCGFTKASFDGYGDEWVRDNAPNTNHLLNEMAKPLRSVFGTSLWSILPFKLGGETCKYIVRPGVSTFADEPDVDDPNFLGKDLAARLAAGPATLEVYIQKRPSLDEGHTQSYLDKHFPLDRATVVWDEKVAVPVKVATIRIDQQDITASEQEIYGNWLAFNIGRTPAANKPCKESSVAAARVAVYQTSADYRRARNGQPVAEPTAPGQPEIANPSCPFPDVHPVNPPGEQPIALTQTQIDQITHVRIHPGIGVSRVGDSTQDYYYGPEVMYPEPTGYGATRDAAGAIKRQAARFRVYGYDQNGDVVAEVQQSANSSIEWGVHVANRKADWFEFNAAMDIPATVDVTVPRRNKAITGSDRMALVIDGGEKKIMGLGMKDSSYVMAGEFLGTPVTLGELRTDSVGRLVVLPGHGVSGSPENKPVFNPANPSTFNNPAGWHDDIADGPVTARVTIGNREFEADSAWVISTPPNYAPDVIGWRSMDDLLRDVYTAAGIMPLPQRVSFQLHVRPILERLSGLQWVNKGFASMFGADAPMDFSDEGLLEKLGTAPESSLYPDPYGELRRTIYNSFRATDSNTVEEGAWPWIYGDAFGYTNPDPSVPPAASTYLKLPKLYDYVLSAWVRGDFAGDYQPGQARYQQLANVPLQEQPEMLDRANMHFCIADAFHPGAELTWPMRHASMYSEPYRIRRREPGVPELDYGKTLTTAKVAAMNGPLYAQGPGDLTRWMAIPWQGDTAFCRSGYDMEYDPYLPTFWPGRVPNQVLTREDYETLMDQNEEMDVRIAAFHNRANWLRQLPSSSPIPEQMMYMIEHFGDMGIVEACSRPDDIDWLPAQLYVENLTPIKQAELAKAHKIFLANYESLGPSDRRLMEAGWESEEQRNEFATILRRGN